MVARSTVFKSNRSQAVRLPKEVAFPDNVHRVEVIVVGQSRLIVPEGQRWTDFFENGPFLSDDFPDEIEDSIPDRDVSFDD